MIKTSVWHTWQKWLERLHSFAESQGGRRSIGTDALDFFWGFFFCDGSCAEHCTDADPDLTLIVTLDAVVEFGAHACILILADPNGLVLTVALAMLFTSPRVFSYKAVKEKERLERYIRSYLVFWHCNSYLCKLYYLLYRTSSTNWVLVSNNLGELSFAINAALLRTRCRH